MKRLIFLVIGLTSLVALGQFSALTERYIDVIKNNTGTDIALQPINKVSVTGLDDNELLIYDNGLTTLDNGATLQSLKIVGGVPTWRDTLPFIADGDLVYRDGGDERLPIGAEGQVLTVLSGFPSWQDAAGGGGGSAGINFVPDGSFEEETLILSSSPLASNSFQTYTTNTELVAEFNEKYLRQNWSGLSNDEVVVEYDVTRTGLDNKQGLFSIFIKTDQEDMDLCVAIDDPTLNDPCEESLTVKIIGDNTWRKYEIPFIFGASNAQFRVISPLLTGTLQIEYDKVYIGTLPDGYIQSIKDVDTDWIDGGPVSITSLSGTNPTKGTIIVDRAWYKRVGDEAIIRYEYKQSTTGTAGTGEYLFGIPAGLQADLNKVEAYTVAEGTTGVWNPSNSLGFWSARGTTINIVGSVVLYDANSVRLMGLSSSSDGVVGNGFADLADNALMHYTATFRVPIEGWNTGRTNVFSQRSELDSSKANSFNARVLANGTVASEDFDFIDGNCNNTIVGGLLCNFVVGVFSQVPSCKYTAVSNATGLSETIRDNISISFVELRTTTSSGTLFNSDVHISCNKQDEDVVKSQEVTGKFTQNNMQDKYSESEIEYGKWNGEQLYRRCFTVASDITNSDNVTTWSSGLNPKGLMNYNGTRWLFEMITDSGSSTRNLQVYYDRSNGNVETSGSGGLPFKLGAGSSFCMNYTK